MVESASTHSPPRPAKVQYLYVPAYGISGLWLLIMILVGLCIALLAAATGAAISNALHPTGWSRILIPFAVSVTVALLLGITAWRGASYVSRKRLNRRSNRLRRLEGLLQIPAAQPRLPHRIIEHYLQFAPAGSRRVKAQILGLPPGSVIAVHPQRSGAHQRPGGIDLAFEPIDFLGDPEALEWLLMADLETRRGGGQALELYCPSLTEAAHNWSRSLWAFGSRILLPIIIGWQMYAWITRGLSQSDIFFGMMFLVLSIVSVFREHKWWLAPGGLVHRHWRLGRKKVRTDFFTRPDSTLLIDLRDNTIRVAENGQFFKISGDDSACWAVLSAWLSRGRTPTLDEILAWIDPDGQHAVDDTSTP